MKKKEIEIIKKIIGCEYFCFGLKRTEPVQYECTGKRIHYIFRGRRYRLNRIPCPHVKLCNEIKKLDNLT